MSANPIPIKSSFRSIDIPVTIGRSARFEPDLALNGHKLRTERAKEGFDFGELCAAFVRAVGVDWLFVFVLFLLAVDFVAAVERFVAAGFRVVVLVGFLGINNCEHYN
jgi:hypothetical protein